MSHSRHWSKRALFTAKRAVVHRILGVPGIVARVGRRRRVTIDGRTLDAQLAALLELEQIIGQVDLTKGSPARARHLLASNLALLDLDPEADVTVTAIDVAGGEGRLAARLYAPVGVSAPSPLVVYFHGGGMVTGDLDTHDAFCRRVAIRARIRMVSVEYRLAPEHPFPASVNDALAAFADVVARAGELGADRSRVGVMGDSAGGTLSASVAQRGGPGTVALQILVYPATDLSGSLPSRVTFGEGYLLNQRTIDWFMTHYLPTGIDRRQPDASPLFREHLAGLAPALVYTAGFDPLRDEGIRYADRLSAAGVHVLHRNFGDLVHGFAEMGGAIDGARRAIDTIAGDLAEALHQSDAAEVSGWAIGTGRTRH